MALRRVLIVAIAAAAVSTAACGDDSTEIPEPTSSAPAPAVLPLTGLAPAGSPPDRPVLVVKVDNSARAEPQVGLSAADLVVEELVEGGLTRLAVMYHSELPSVVAPVRSVRTSDIGIVAPTGGLLVASGGAGRVLRAIEDAGLLVATEGSPGFSREESRRAPYNLAVDLAAVLTEAAGLESPPGPYLPWATGATAAAGEPAATVSVRFSAAHTTRWEWNGDTWHRVDDLAAQGDEFTPDNLLVLRVTTRDAGYTDPAGNPVPETVTTGSGDAILLADGTAVQGRWSKRDDRSPLSLTDAAGADLGKEIGNEWVEGVLKAVADAEKQTAAY